jgi:hypothetical protein
MFEILRPLDGLRQDGQTMFDDLPPITIVMTTYFPDGVAGKLRRSVANETLKSWNERLLYRGDLYLHIADDGSEEVIQEGMLGYSDWWEKETFSRQEHHGVGASLNIGFAQAFKSSPLVFYAVDDWCLRSSLDLTPWAILLLTRTDVGMVRLGPPHPGTSGKIEAFTDDWQGWALRLDRQGFAFGHRPALYHKRMIMSHGWFSEDTNALECERLYNENFCKAQGPDIVMALAHPFEHLESIELADVEPETLR